MSKITVAQLELVVAQQGAKINELESKLTALLETTVKATVAKPSTQGKRCNICSKFQCKGHKLCDECHGPDGRHSSQCSFNPGPCEECGGLNGGHKKYAGWSADGEAIMLTCSK